MSIRAAFEEAFGAECAANLVSAAESHGNGLNDSNKGSDPFKWALCIAIGYQCAELPQYAECHGLDSARWPEIKDWIREHADLSSHDGGFDTLALLAGTYREYMPAEAQP